MDYSVVIPAYNEADKISSSLTQAVNFMRTFCQSFEIIVIDDGSKDATASIVEEYSVENPEVRVIRNPHKGKGFAVLTGMNAAVGNLVYMADADLSAPMTELKKLAVWVTDQNFDIAIASRFVPGLKVTKPVLWHRQFMEKIFRLLRMVITNNYSIQDTQCGFKVFSREVAMKIFPLMTIDRFAFDAEVIFVAVKSGYWIKELPIILQNPTESSIRIYRDSLNMLLDLIRIRINYFSGKYTGKISIDKD